MFIFVWTISSKLLQVVGCCSLSILSVYQDGSESKQANESNKSPITVMEPSLVEPSILPLAWKTFAILCENLFTAALSVMKETAAWEKSIVGFCEMLIYAYDTCVCVILGQSNDPGSKSSHFQFLVTLGLDKTFNLPLSRAQPQD